MNIYSNKPKTKIDLVSDWVLWLSAGVFVVFYLVLALYNRPAFDDLGFIYFTKEHSLFANVFQLYKTVAGRFSAWVYMYVVFYLINDFKFIYLFIYYLVTLVVFIYAVNKIIHVGLQKLFQYNASSKNTLKYSILFIACFYFFTFNGIETWWYLCASFHYLQGIVFLLLGVAVLLKERKKNFDYLLIVLSFVYVGACYEIYALIVGFLFLVCLLNYKKIYEEIKVKWFYKGFVVAFVSVLVSGVVCVFSQGNIDKRVDYKQHFTEFYHATNWDEVMRMFMEKKYLVAIVLSLIWIIVGINLKNNSSVIINKKSVRRVIYFFFIALICSIVIVYLFQLLFLYGIYVPSRGWAFTSFMLAVTSCFLFVIVGYHLPEMKIHLQVFIKIVIPFIVLLVLSGYTIRQYNYVSVYGKKYDEMIALFIDAKKNNRKDTLYIDKLPASGMLMQLDMADDSHCPIYLKNILGLEFEIKVRE